MKEAAIWARVSTRDQAELSPESQVERVRAKLEKEGCLIPPNRILKADWTSMDLFACPDFRRLQGWIRNREIQALGVLDRDRLNAQGLQRLTFLAECRDNGVEVVVCQGPPMLEGPEGDLVEMALAIGKYRSVLRAQQGAKDGHHDRATIKKLPPAPVNPYGYAWDASRTRLQPTKDWPHANFICREALAGATLIRLQKALYARGIHSPTGRLIWPITTLWGLLRNPIYGGRFYALRREAVEPGHRRGQTYGQSSSRHIPLDKAIYLDNIVVENPPLTWGEYISIRERLKANQLRASRNARRSYRLRGFVICDIHHRHYRGRPSHNSFDYQCPCAYALGQPRCPHPYINGPGLEEAVFTWAEAVLAHPEIVELEVAHQGGLVEESEKNLGQYLKDLEQRQRKNVASETALVGLHIRGECSREAYERQGKLLQAERTWLADEVAQTQSKLESLTLKGKARLSLETVKERVEKAAADDPRLLLEALGVEVHVRENGDIVMEASIPVDASIVSSTP
jgi:hypothetical protein